MSVVRIFSCLGPFQGTAQLCWAFLCALPSGKSALSGSRAASGIDTEWCLFPLSLIFCTLRIYTLRQFAPCQWISPCSLECWQFLWSGSPSGESPQTSPWSCRTRRSSDCSSGTKCVTWVAPQTNPTLLSRHADGSKCSTFLTVRRLSAFRTSFLGIWASTRSGSIHRAYDPVRTSRTLKRPTGRSPRTDSRCAKPGFWYQMESLQSRQSASQPAASRRRSWRRVSTCFSFLWGTAGACTQWNKGLSGQAAAHYSWSTCFRCCGGRTACGSNLCSPWAAVWRRSPLMKRSDLPWTELASEYLPLVGYPIYCLLE